MTAGAAFVLGRLMVSSANAGLAWGILGGTLAGAVRGAGFTRISVGSFEEAGAFVFLFVVGLSSATWTLRRSAARATAASLHVGSACVLAASGAFATIGSGSFAWMLLAALILGWASAGALCDGASWMTTAATVPLVFVAAFLQGFAEPVRVSRTFMALGGGAFLAAFLASPRGEGPRGVAAVVGVLVGLAPWLAVS